MKGVDWGPLHNGFKDADLDPVAIEEETDQLMIDDEVTKRPGIYRYILTRDETHLNIRAFSKAMKRKVYEKQEGICPECGNWFPIEDMDADHIIPWSKGGKTNEENCRMVSKKCNLKKGAR